MEGESTELAQRVDSRSSRIRLLAGLGGVSLVSLGTVAFLASWMDRFPGDVTLAQWIQSWRTSWLDSVMKAVSVPGFLMVATSLVAVAVAFLFLKGMRRESGQVVAVTVAAYFLNSVLKEMVARPRPSADLVDTITGASGPSFPSGHVMHYAAFLGVLMVISA